MCFCFSIHDSLPTWITPSPTISMFLTILHSTIVSSSSLLFKVYIRWEVSKVSPTNPMLLSIETAHLAISTVPFLGIGPCFRLLKMSSLTRLGFPQLLISSVKRASGVNNKLRLDEEHNGDNDIHVATDKGYDFVGYSTMRLPLPEKQVTWSRSKGSSTVIFLKSRMSSITCFAGQCRWTDQPLEEKERAQRVFYFILPVYWLYQVNNKGGPILNS